MTMNSSDFPLVWLNFSHQPGHDAQKDFDEFEANLKRGESFVILSDSSPSEDHEHTPEEKKLVSLWMKKHKLQLRTLVLAMIVVEPSQAKRVAYKAMSAMFAKFWGYPMILAASREQAIDMARELLSTGAVSPQ